MVEFLARFRSTRWSGAGAVVPTIVRMGAGGFFISTGIGKFLDYSHEVDEFRRFEVPLPDVAVPLVGTVEVIGGVLLLVGFATRFAAAALALNMVGALLTAGRVVGGDFHLVFAPTLLVLTLFIVWVGPGRPSIDDRLDRTRSGVERK